MSNEQFNRMILNPRERPLSSDINQAQSQLDRTQREILKAMFASRTGPMVDTSAFVAGFIGDGFKVRAAAIPDMTTTVTAGMGFYQDPADVPAAIGGIIGLDDYCSYKPLPLIAPLVIPTPTAPGAGQERWDIIEVAVIRRAEGPLVRETFDPTTSTFVSGLVNKTLSFTMDTEFGYAPAPGGSVDGISYVQGVAAAVGAAVVPAVTPGYQKIGEVYVGATVVAINPGDINDCRRMLFPGGVGHLAMSWIQRTAADVPASLLVQGSPGVEATVMAQGPLGGIIYVKAGGQMTGLLPGVAHFYPSAWGSVVVTPGVSGVLTAGSKTNLADVTKVATQVYWGVKQRVSAWIYQLYNGASAGIGHVQPNDETGIVSVDLSLIY